MITNYVDKPFKLEVNIVFMGLTWMLYFLDHCVFYWVKTLLTLQG